MAETDPRMGDGMWSAGKIEAEEFAIEFRGYERVAVRAFLAAVASQQEMLIDEVERLRAELRRHRRAAAEPAAVTPLPVPAPPELTGEPAARAIVDTATGLSLQIIDLARREREAAMAEAKAILQAAEAQARLYIGRALESSRRASEREVPVPLPGELPGTRHREDSSYAALVNRLRDDLRAAGEPQPPPPPERVQVPRLRVAGEAAG